MPPASGALGNPDPARQLQGIKGGRSEKLGAPLPPQLGHSSSRQRLGPRAPRPGLRPSSGSPGLALPQVPPVVHTSASQEGTVRAVGTVVSVPAAPEPKPSPAQRALSPGSAVRQASPGAGLGAGRPARPQRLRRTGAHRQCVKSACSPPLGRRLCSAGLARPAQPLSSAPFRSPELHSAYPRTGLLPDTSGAPWVSEAIL